MKTLIFSALALALALPSVASAEEAIVIQTHRHHHRHHYWNDNNNDRVVIYRDGQRLHRRHHGQVTFYDNGERAWRRHHRSGDLMITGSVYRPFHPHRHVIIQQYDNSDRDY